MKIVSRPSLLVGTASMLLATAALYGCKNFLSDAGAPRGSLNQASLATPGGVEGTLIAAYRALDCTYGTQGPGWGCAASNWVWGTVAGGDSYKGSTIGDQPPINDVEWYAWNTANANSYINEKWTLTYEGINRANSALRLLNQVAKASPGAFSKADSAGIAGEAIFLRAYYHFEAYRMWGNIPYYRETDADFRKPNEDTTAVIADVEKDLNTAIGLLPTSPRNGQKGRADKWTAMAYLGRVQMYAHDYQAALTTLKAVQAAHVYGLEKSFSDVWTGFQSKENGPETIWAFEASANDGNPDGENSNYGERLNFPYAASAPGGCCGFNQPTQNLVNAFKVDPATGLPLEYTNPDSWNASDLHMKGGDMTPVDPRLDWTVGRDSVPYKDWGIDISKTWVRDSTNGGVYSPKKNAHEAASGAESKAGWQPSQLNSVNVHLFRYADLMLLLAEAEAQTGDLAGATVLVDSVRMRARGDFDPAHAAQGCGLPTDATTSAIELLRYPQCAGQTAMAVPIDDPHITWAKYQIGLYPTFTSQADALRAIQIERRVELAMEGQRFFDLRRWGVKFMESELNGYLNGIGGGSEIKRMPWLKSAAPVGDQHRFYPIPQAQIDLSNVSGKPALKQNPGW